MKLGDIVEFVYTGSTSKYIVRIDRFFSSASQIGVGGIDSRCWFVKTHDGWHNGNSGYFPFGSCKSVKLCENKKILKKFR